MTLLVVVDSSSHFLAIETALSGLMSQTGRSIPWLSYWSSYFHIYVSMTIWNGLLQFKLKIHFTKIHFTNIQKHIYIYYVSAIIMRLDILITGSLNLTRTWLLWLINIRNSTCYKEDNNIFLSRSTVYNVHAVYGHPLLNWRRDCFLC